MEAAYGWPPNAWRQMGWRELQMRYLRHRERTEQAEADQRWAAAQGRAMPAGSRVRGHH